MLSFNRSNFSSTTNINSRFMFKSSLRIIFSVCILLKVLVLVNSEIIRRLRLINRGFRHSNHFLAIVISAILALSFSLVSSTLESIQSSSSQKHRTALTFDFFFRILLVWFSL
jgi:hypothetical protein